MNSTSCTVVQEGAHLHNNESWLPAKNSRSVSRCPVVCVCVCVCVGGGGGWAGGKVMSFPERAERTPQV